MRVGFIGLGTMGQHLANHLQEGGYDLVVNDIREERAMTHLTAGAEWAATPSAVMAACDVVFTSVPTPADVEAIALGPNGLIESAARGKVFFDMSTNSPTVMRRIHDRFEPLGVAVLDAPVSGGLSGAKSGKLVIFVGGDESVYESHRAMLATMGDQPFYVGPIGVRLGGETRPQPRLPVDQSRHQRSDDDGGARRRRSAAPVALDSIRRCPVVAGPSTSRAPSPEGSTYRRSVSVSHARTCGSRSSSVTSWTSRCGSRASPSTS